MSKAVKADFSVSGLGGDSVLGGAGTMSNPANEGLSLIHI